jgi:hypothetical protein
MHLFCAMGRHRPEATPVWNEGFYFSACGRCGVDLVSRGRRWQRVPAGYRVVWRTPPAGYPDWKRIGRKAANLPAQAERPSAR